MVRRVSLASFRANDRIRRSVERVLSSGMLSHRSPVVKQFEEKFAQWVGAKYAVACDHGSSALVLALRAVRPEPARYGIVAMPESCYVAVANAIYQAGFRPYPSFVSAATWNAKAQAPKDFGVRVHTLGALAKHPLGFQEVEDCCERLMRGMPGDPCVYSFYGNKTITAGEGGIVCTNSHDTWETASHLRDQATSGEYRHNQPGWNMRMTALQAAVLIPQIDELDYRIERRRTIRDAYLDNLPTAYKPQPGRRTEHAAWAMGVRCPRPAVDVQEYLATKGIETRAAFAPLQPPSLFWHEPSPEALYLRRHGLILPIHHHMTERDVKYVCQKLKEAQ